MKTLFNLIPKKIICWMVPVVGVAFALCFTCAGSAFAFNSSESSSSNESFTVEYPSDSKVVYKFDISKPQIRVDRTNLDCDQYYSGRKFNHQISTKINGCYIEKPWLCVREYYDVLYLAYQNHTASWAFDGTSTKAVVCALDSNNQCVAKATASDVCFEGNGTINSIEFSRDYDWGYFWRTDDVDSKETLIETNYCKPFDDPYKWIRDYRGSFAVEEITVWD